MKVPRSAAAVLVGYVLGTLPSADVAGKLVGTNLRHAGTRNPGASNAATLLGKRWGAAVAVVDIGKGWLAGSMGRRIGPNTAYAAATAAVLGHIHPLWFGFRGGKGVATSYGAVLSVFPAYAVPDLAVAAVAVRVTKDQRRANYISSVAWTAAAVLWWRRRMPNLWGPPVTVGLPISAALTSGLIAWRFHRS